MRQIDRLLHSGLVTELLLVIGSLGLMLLILWAAGLLRPT
jgi:hypothetical protein